ncbi:DUF1697 domain-containing protein [Marisediminicola senii]|uniref:DUF1697 domain-containing protein n=1 Tax=Marisediminicola senii TaxID=2711233 RepID=UPI0013E9D825|nr:DUF1697 domain-containing protein [Marisediminicola senii]
MRTHVALLRGVNVGGHNRLPMADLRALVSTLGYRDVATHIQSGNVAFGCSEPDETRIADALEHAILARTDFAIAVVVVTAHDLRTAHATTPFPTELDARRVHVVFYRDPLDDARTQDVIDTQERLRAAGSDDRAVVRGRFLYLHTPHGLGTSRLASELLRVRAGSPVGTARNWATVQRLVTMLD